MTTKTDTDARLREIAVAAASQIARNWGDEDERANTPDVDAIESAIREGGALLAEPLREALEAMLETWKYPAYPAYQQARAALAAFDAAVKEGRE